MPAVVLAFPVVPRPIPLAADPRYRKGVEDFAAHIMRERHGMDRTEAQRVAHDLTEQTFHRALVEAGYAPLSEYVDRHGA